MEYMSSCKPSTLALRFDIFMNKSVLIVIPARGGSKGIHQKNLRKVHGVSLTEWAVRSAIDLGSRHKATISLSSDDVKILAIVSKYPSVIPSKRPAELSGDSVPDFQVLRHELSLAEQSLKRKIDTVVMLQPTSPLRNLNLLDEAVRKVKSGDFTSIWSISEVPLKYHPRKQLEIRSEQLLLSVDSPLVRARQELTSTFIRNGVFYVFNRYTVLSDEKLMGSKCGYFRITSETFNIDELQDLKKLRVRTEVIDNQLILRERH
jgi:CMP-N,N'-diacetyllegionaminic acid synthase